MSWYSDCDNPPDPTRKKKLYHRYFSRVRGRILDVGCSTGNFIQHAPGRAIGIDLDRDGLRVARSRAFSCLQGDVTRGFPFPDDTFEAVNCDSILEHLHDPLTLLREVHRVLVRNGKLIVITPNIYRVRHRFWRDYTHIHPFCPESLRRIAYDAGFRNVSVRTYSLNYLKAIAALTPSRGDGRRPFWWFVEDIIGWGVASNALLEAFK